MANARMDIADRLRDRFGAQIEIPPKDPRNPWVRLDCPACKGDRAALNYGAGWFKCYRCKLDISARKLADPEAWAIERFRLQIERAVSKAKGSYGKWIEKKEALNQAYWLVYNYAAGKEAKNDGGMLDQWEADFDGEPWRLDGKVQCVLDRDLMNWAQSEKTWKEKTHESGDMRGDRDSGKPALAAVSEGIGYNLRARKARAIMDIGGTVFAKPNLDGPFDLGELKRCELQRNGGGPTAGHCKWCDRAISDGTVSAWDRKYRNGNGAVDDEWLTEIAKAADQRAEQSKSDMTLAQDELDMAA